MRTLLLSLLMLVFLPSLAQHRKTYFPLWTFHQSNIRIYGVAVGWFPLKETVNTTSNGLRLEAIGPGIFVPFIPRSPWDSAHSGHVTPPDKKNVPEKVNGINLSGLGSINYSINGISIGGIGQLNWYVNGIAVSAMINITHTCNGIQFGTMAMSHKMNGLQIGLNVETEYMRGIQIGMFTESKNTRGLQFGIWNVNEKRKLPLINWNFRP